jgi:N-acetylglucosaminyldiphosphoundecaprenol N-acetyl-beta-D-mannosaminyltransferase
MKTVKIFGLDFVNSNTKSVVADLVAQASRGKKLRTVVTPNPEQIVRAWKDGWFRGLLEQANMKLPDGSGIVWASKQYTKRGLLSKVISNRITGADVVQGLIDQTSDKSLKMVLIGGYAYQSAGEPTDYPDVYRLKIGSDHNMIYWCHAYQYMNIIQSSDNKVVIDLISDWKPDVVLVALGAPWQESWLMVNREFLAKQKVKLAMVVGGSFDFLTGKVSRAPKKWQKRGLEWLWRLLQEPWRWRRQLALVQFWWRVKFDKKVSGLSGSGK